MFHVSVVHIVHRSANQTQHGSQQVFLRFLRCLCAEQRLMGSIFHSPLSLPICIPLFHLAELIQSGQIPLLRRPTQERSYWEQYATRFIGNGSPEGLQAQLRRFVSKQTKTYESSKWHGARGLLTITCCRIVTNRYSAPWDYCSPVPRRHRTATKASPGSSGLISQIPATHHQVRRRFTFSMEPLYQGEDSYDKLQSIST